MKRAMIAQIKSFLTQGVTPTLLATAILSLGAALPAWADGKDGRGDDGNPGVFPPHSHPYGKNYGEWAVKWWQWVLSIPADRNPLTDTNGAFAGEAQRASVVHRDVAVQVLPRDFVADADRLRRFEQEFAVTEEGKSAGSKVRVLKSHITI